jgi:hypothetical protein
VRFCHVRKPDEARLLIKSRDVQRLAGRTEPIVGAAAVSVECTRCRGGWMFRYGLLATSLSIGACLFNSGGVAGEYLYPGVYVDEVPTGKPIEGVNTSTSPGTGRYKKPSRLRQGRDPATVQPGRSRIPGQPKFSNVTLEHGTISDNSLYNWHSDPCKSRTKIECRSPITSTPPKQNNLDKFDHDPSYASPSNTGAGTRGTKRSKDGVSPNKSTNTKLFTAPQKVPGQH